MHLHVCALEAVLVCMLAQILHIRGSKPFAFAFSQVTAFLGINDFDPYNVAMPSCSARVKSCSMTYVPCRRPYVGVFFLLLILLRHSEASY